MIKKSTMSPDEHKETGLKLWALREQMMCLTSPQFRYVKNGYLRVKINRQHYKVLLAVDEVRFFLNKIGYRDLPGALSHHYYFPGSQDIEIPKQLIGTPPDSATQFFNNSELRENLGDDGQTPSFLSREDGRIIFSFYSSTARDVLDKITRFSENWPDKTVARKLKYLCERAKKVLNTLAVSLQEIGG